MTSPYRCLVHSLFVVGLILSASSLASVTAADPPAARAAEPDPAAETLRFTVRVVDDQGKPVPETRVTPWAIRSELGHGVWPGEESKVALKPKEVVTDAAGLAAIEYPVYHDPLERVRATAITLQVDHPRFGYLSHVDVEVPRAGAEPQKIELTPGVSVSFFPHLDGQRVKGDDIDRIHAVWSDGRCWTPGGILKRSKGEQPALRIPAMAPGRNSILFVRVEGERVTHFSRIDDFELKAGVIHSREVNLTPALRITGTVSDNVPRPVRHGRINFATLNPTDDEPGRVWWTGWTTIAPDGSFVIDSWPAGEPLQVIALCDGFMAASGTPPKAVKRPAELDEEEDLTVDFTPQVFEPEPEKLLSLPMVPMGRCEVTARDPEGKPVPGVTVTSWPNVFWWNGGSQVYCDGLVNLREVLVHRGDLEKSRSKDFPAPFQVKTGADGKGTLELPVRTQVLYVMSDAYELPVRANAFLPDQKDRSVEVEIEPEKTTGVVLRLQPRGTERLGEEKRQ